MAKGKFMAMGVSGLLMLGGGGVVALLAVGGGVYFWATSATHTALHTTYETHEVDFPVPFPLSDEELAELRAEKIAAMGEGEEAEGAEGEDPVDPLEGVDLKALAMERAKERGRHYATGRYLCIDCHGEDFAGGEMINDPAMGMVLGPNLTPGSRVADFTPADWDRAVRHGVNGDGLGTLMPIGDFKKMSDRELSDIIVWANSLPASDAVVPRPQMGPVGTMLIATGNLKPEVSTVEDHHAPHEALPPKEEVNVEFGAHLAQVCVGCHGEALDGGPIPIGPPDWPPASNLTTHAEGLEGWTLEQFVSTMRTGKRADGSEVLAPMTMITPYANEMTDLELEAIWVYLQSVPAKPTGT